MIIQPGALGRAILNFGKKHYYDKLYKWRSKSSEGNAKNMERKFGEQNILMLDSVVSHTAALQSRKGPFYILLTLWPFHTRLWRPISQQH